MSRPIFKWTALIQIGLAIFSGCTPTQPFFVARDESLAHYVAQSMDIEYSDVAVDSLPEATHATVPLGPDKLPDNFMELTLEDCVSMALQNSKILRVVGGSSTQSGTVAGSLLSAQPGQMPSVWDPAQVATTANSQPLAVDSQGTRVAPRGFLRANQVGGVEDALSEFDAQFSALFGYNTTDRPRNVQALGSPVNVFNPQQFQAVDSNAQAAISKRLATGTIATLRTTATYSRNNIAIGVGRAVPSDYTTTIEMQVNQPLLRGRGTLVNRIPIVLARINEDLELHQFEANIRNLVKGVEDAYWDLYCGYRAFESAKTAQESALDLWRVAQARTQIGDAPPETEAQARALYHQFKAQVHTSLYGSRVPGNDPLGLYGREQVLREKIGWAATDGQMIRPLDDPTVARIHFDWHDIQAEALVRNTELRRQKWAIKQRELELITSKNQILPQLDVVAFYRWLGVGDVLATAERNGLSLPQPGSSAIEALTGGDYQEIGARLEYTPQAIGKRRALANIQNSHIAVVKFKEELRTKENMLIHELSRTYREMESHFQSMKDYLDQWQANEDEVEIYNDQIENNVGVLSQLLDNLLRSEERRSRAQLFYYQAVCEYNKSIVNMHYLKGSLLDLNSVCLEEGPWLEKAYWDAEERASERASGIYFDYGYTRPAVVSNGPVESGGATQGNMATSGATFGDQAAGTEYVPPRQPEDEAPLLNPENDAQGDEQDPQLKPLPERDRTAIRPGQDLSVGNVRRSGQLQTASSAGFDWGELGGLRGATSARAASAQAASAQTAMAHAERSVLEPAGATNAGYAAPVVSRSDVQSTSDTSRGVRVISRGTNHTTHPSKLNSDATEGNAWQPR